MITLRLFLIAFAAMMLALLTITVCCGKTAVAHDVSDTMPTLERMWLISDCETINGTDFYNETDIHTDFEGNTYIGSGGYWHIGYVTWMWMIDEIVNRWDYSSDAFIEYWTRMRAIRPWDAPQHVQQTIALQLMYYEINIEQDIIGNHWLHCWHRQI